MQAVPITTDKNFRPQLHYFLLLLVPVLCIGTFLLYASFVYQSVWRPGRWWWFLTTGAIAVSSLAAGWLVVKRFWYRSQQTWAIAIFMFTVWPVVLFLCFVWLMVATANGRGDLRLSLPVRTFAFWVSNYFEWETGYRYPRVTTGQFVELHDSGSTPNVEAMVEQMDRHIETMCQLLDKRPSKTKTGWVRGAVFGQTGRAVGAWALCKTSEEFGELQTLDRHEVAHATITTLAAGLQDPPMLLAEGWAQSQGNDNDELISSLRTSRRSGFAIPLQELVSEKYYGRSIYPNYSHGGPLVIYLLQRFGGPKFYELYTEVRRPSFLEDAERILGEPWTAIEKDFWIWLDSAPPPKQKRLAVVFANEPVREKWKDIENLVKLYEQMHPFDASSNYAVRFLMDDGTYQPSVVVEDGRVWMITEYPDMPERMITYAIRTEAMGEAYVEEVDTGQFEGEPEIQAGSATIQLLANNALKRLLAGALRNQGVVDLFEWQLFEENETEVSVESIEPGEKPEEPWRVKWNESRGAGVSSASYDLLLDPENGFRVIESKMKVEEKTYIGRYQYGLLDGRPVTIKAESIKKMPDGTVERQADSELIPLSLSQIKEVKARVENAVSRRRQQVETDWNSLFLNPYSIAFGWLGIAIVVLTIDFIGNRWKFPAPTQNSSAAT